MAKAQVYPGYGGADLPDDAAGAHPGTNTHQNA